MTVIKHRTDVVLIVVTKPVLIAEERIGIGNVDRICFQRKAVNSIEQTVCPLYDQCFEGIIVGITVIIHITQHGLSEHLVLYLGEILVARRDLTRLLVNYVQFVPEKEEELVRLSQK